MNGYNSLSEIRRNGRFGVILVGQGGVPTDCPRELVTRLKSLESQRRRTDEAPSYEEILLDQQIRRWPRTHETDPYKAGLESLAEHLHPLLNGHRLAIAYNEFCSPTLEEAASHMIDEGTAEIAILLSMLTPGGVHSEVEIPKMIDRLRAEYPRISFHYLWPFELSRVAEMFASQLSSRILSGNPESSGSRR